MKGSETKHGTTDENDKKKKQINFLKKNRERETRFAGGEVGGDKMCLIPFFHFFSF